MDGTRRVPCVGAVARDAAGALLLVQRANEPGKGRWSLPGGRVEHGETDAEALVREVAEETGLVVSVGDRIGAVTLPGPAGQVYEVADYRCEVTGGTLRAGDDAAAVRWVPTAALDDLALTDGLAETLADWGVLDRAE